MPHTYDISLPSGHHPDVDQDEEWFEVGIDGDRRRLRIHDYQDIFSIAGLYEQLIDGELKCSSPRTMATVLAALVESDGEQMADLTVLDFAAGNGMMAAELAARGVGSLTGVDNIAEAAEAAQRDRPGLYRDYVVADLTDMAPDVRRRLEDERFNCLTLVAALSFDEVPPEAFAEAFNMVADGGWIAFNVKHDLLQDRDDGGIGALVTRMAQEGVMEQRASVRYRHRLSVRGEPIYYVALMGRKQAQLPLEWTAGE